MKISSFLRQKFCKHRLIFYNLIHFALISSVQNLYCWRNSLPLQHFTKYFFKAKTIWTSFLQVSKVHKDALLDIKPLLSWILKWIPIYKSYQLSNQNSKSCLPLTILFYGPSVTRMHISFGHNIWQLLFFQQQTFSKEFLGPRPDHYMTRRH